MRYKVFDSFNTITDEVFSRRLTDVSEQRREKVLRYKFREGRHQSLLAYLLLQEMLFDDFGISSPPEFIENEHGKPSIIGHEDVFFNISHCSVGVACVVGSKPVGIDIEKIDRKVSESLCRYVLSEEELEMVTEAVNPQAQFVRLWTMKEAYVKMIGTGISGSEQLKPLLNDFHRSIWEGGQLPYTIQTIVNEEKGWVMSVAEEL